MFKIYKNNLNLIVNINKHIDANINEYEQYNHIQTESTQRFS